MDKHARFNICGALTQAVGPVTDRAIKAGLKRVMDPMPRPSTRFSSTGYNASPGKESMDRNGFAHTVYTRAYVHISVHQTASVRNGYIRLCLKTLADHTACVMIPSCVLKSASRMMVFLKACLTGK